MLTFKTSPTIMPEIDYNRPLERIKKRRASDGFDDIPEDLLAKRRKYDLPLKEWEKQQERRIRNKEAAGKSRQKRKLEFEKLQNDNDQLNQDKCDLAATIKTLRQENVDYHFQLKHLKRWIAKHASQLGLQKKENILPVQSPAKSEEPPGDPSPCKAKGDNTEDRFLDTESSHSPSAPPPPSSETSSKADSLPSASNCQAASIKTTPQRRHDLLSPWLVTQPTASSTVTQASVAQASVAAQERTEDGNKTATTVTSSFQPISAAEPAVDPIEAWPVQVLSEKSQVVYVPQPVIIMQGEGGQQIAMPAPPVAPVQFVYGPNLVAGFPQMTIPYQSQIYGAA